jgi:hypothetical protein
VAGLRNYKPGMMLAIRAHCCCLVTVLSSSITPRRRILLVPPLLGRLLLLVVFRSIAGRGDFGTPHLVSTSIGKSVIRLMSFAGAFIIVIVMGLRGGRSFLVHVRVRVWFCSRRQLTRGICLSVCLCVRTLFSVDSRPLNNRPLTIMREIPSDYLPLSPIFSW